MGLGHASAVFRWPVFQEFVVRVLALVHVVVRAENNLFFLAVDGAGAAPYRQLLAHLVQRHVTV